MNFRPGGVSQPILGTCATLYRMNANRREMSDLDLSEEKKEIRAFSSLNASSSEIAFVYKLSKYSCILQGLEAGHRYVIRDTIYLHEL